jgi:hypothetical protein
MEWYYLPLRRPQMEKETLATWPEDPSEDRRVPRYRSISSLAVSGRADYIPSRHSGCHWYIEIFTGGETQQQFHHFVQMFS